MNEIPVTLLGWQGKRQDISDMTLYAEDPQHRVASRLSLPPDTTAVRLGLEPGRYKVYVLFTAAPYAYYASAGELDLPGPPSVTIDLDKAEIDDVVQPPP